MYKVLKNFSGKISSTEGKIIDIKNEECIKDLIQAGYIEEFKEETKKVSSTSKKVKK